MEVLGLISDILIVVLLIWTIIVAGRLAKNLIVFNQSKKELSKLIRQVSDSVVHADRALKEFKQGVNESGKGLSDKISEAKMLSDELELIYQASNRVADRLEKLTESTPRKSAESTSGATAAKKKTTSAEKKTVAAKPAPKSRGLDWVKKTIKKTASGEVPSGDEDNSPFSIRDPEFEQGLKEDAKGAAADEPWDGPEGIESEAERELYKALKSRAN